jgi:hypothetical protein
MRIYLDDDSVSGLLIRLLVKAGHDVQIPADVGKAGQDDPPHLVHAVREGRILLTHNHHDFENLHELVLEVGGHYPGMLVIRKDNDPKRDMSERDIVSSIRKLVASGVLLRDEIHVLNHWR